MELSAANGKKFLIFNGNIIWHGRSKLTVFIPSTPAINIVMSTYPNSAFRSEASNVEKGGNGT